MFELRRSLSGRHVINLAGFISLTFLLLFASDRALAQRGVRPLISQPGKNPPTYPCTCKRRPSHHAGTLSATIKPDPSTSQPVDPSFAVEAYLFVGNRARDAANYDEAESHYRQVLKLDPQEWRAYYGLGNIFFDQAFVDKPEEVNDAFLNKAIEAYREAIRLSSQDNEKEDAEVADLYSDLAQVYLQKLDLIEAQKLITEALRLNKRSASAIRRQGSIYLVQGGYKEPGLTQAVNKYQESLQIEGDNALTHRALGAAYNLQGKFDQAIAEFKTAAQLRTDYVMAYQDIGLFYFERRNFKEAIEAYRQALKLNPRLVYSRANLIVSYCESGDRNLALSQYEELKKLNTVKARELEPRIQMNCPSRQP